MTKKSEPTAPSAERSGIDWRKIASATCTKVDWTTVAQRALGSATLAMLVGGAVAVIGRAIEADLQARKAGQAQAADEPSVIDVPYEVVSDAAPIPEPTVRDDDTAVSEEIQAPPIDVEAANAAALLGIAIDASADEVRAALRRALSASRLHPDHGGDGEQAKVLIAAKNLLIDRAVRCARESVGGA
jgi:hypothetical protein